MAEHVFTYEILNKLFNNIVGKTLGEIDTNSVFKRTEKHPKITGIAGDVIEQSVLGYPADTKKQADLSVQGDEIELKCTGLRRVKKATKKDEIPKWDVVAKEPMSITSVSPQEIIKEEFETSTLWHKLEKMLWVYYLYDSKSTVLAAGYAEFKIHGFHFNEFDEEEKKVLKQDWTIVRDFIRNVHEQGLDINEEYPKISQLTNKMTYMDTAPKWPHPPRFRLKRAFVSTKIQKALGETFEPLATDVDFHNYEELDLILQEKTRQYIGKTIKEMGTELGLKSVDKRKGINEQLITMMFLGKTTKLNQIEMFSKLDLVAKSVVLNSKNRPREDTKFELMDFPEWTARDTVFEDSYVYNYFSEKTFLVSIYKEPYPGAPMSKCVFEGFKRIRINPELIDTEMRRTWEEVRDLVNNEKLTVTPMRNAKGELRYTKTKVLMKENNFPKAATHVLFVKGTGQNATKKPFVLNGFSMYYQYFWINKTTMNMMLNSTEYI